MTTRPRLETDRLILRPFEMTDAAAVQTLAGDPEVAKTTLNIPHPYPNGAAEEWFRIGYEQMDKGRGYPLAMVRKADGVLVGCMAIGISQSSRKGELAYWVGRPYWGYGYATEAARVLMHWAFTNLELNKVFAAFMTHNPASGRVMQKLGMQYEGTFRQDVYKDGVPVDIGFYGILRSEYKG